MIDHLGLSQPHEPPPAAEPFADLPKLLALAPHDNIVVEVSGACTLSHEPSLSKTSGTLFEGFDTPDLNEAKALLDELGTARS